MNIKFVWNHKKPCTAKITLAGGGKQIGIILPNFKIYCSNQTRMKLAYRQTYT
jgi:hypothetical protein